MKLATLAISFATLLSTSIVSASPSDRADADALDDCTTVVGPMWASMARLTGQDATEAYIDGATRCVEALPGWDYESARVVARGEACWFTATGTALAVCEMAIAEQDAERAP